MSNHEDGIRAAERYAEVTGIPMRELRRIAADHLHEDWPQDEGMGTSDISCHLSSMFLYDMDIIAERTRVLAIVARSARESGKSFDETLDTFRRLFAPA